MKEQNYELHHHGNGMEGKRMTREEAAMCKEIARELRQQLPEQVNLADLMGAEAFMGSMWGWDDPAPYAMDRAACWLEALADSSPTPDPSTGLLPCEYCTDTFDQKPLLQENKYKPYTRMMSTIYIEENNGKHQIEIDLWDGGNAYAAFEINYCPMCGRKLEVDDMNRQEAALVIKDRLNDEIWKQENGLEVFPVNMDAFRVAIKALRGPVPDPDTGLKGCWHCRNIEAHHIEYVIAVKAKGGTPMNTPVDCPYHYCPACGRKLEVEG